MEKRLWTASEAAAVLGLSKSVIYELLGSGAIESVKIGRSRRIPTQAIDTFVASLRDRRAPESLA